MQTHKEKGQTNNQMDRKKERGSGGKGKTKGDREGKMEGERIGKREGET